jgi:hypothetical protein
MSKDKKNILTHFSYSQYFGDFITIQIENVIFNKK